MIEGGKGGLEDIDTTGLDVVTISKEGEDIDFAQHLAAGKTTIVDFYADWCVPCKVLEAKLVERMRENDRIALRKVNIVDWASAVAKKLPNPGSAYDGASL